MRVLLQVHVADHDRSADRARGRVDFLEGALDPVDRRLRRGRNALLRSLARSQRRLDGEPGLSAGVFGLRRLHWTPEKAAKFAAGHRSTDFSLPALLRYFAEIPVHSDWQSGLVFAFAPLPLALCLFLRRSERNRCAVVWGLAALIGWQFIAFWVLTHRLDRFWLPLLPFACVLAGAGWSAIPPMGRAWIVNPLAAVVLLYNFSYCTTRYCALNDYTQDLMEHRRFSKGSASKAVLFADESGRIPPRATVLFVGFGGVTTGTIPTGTIRSSTTRSSNGWRPNRRRRTAYAPFRNFAEVREERISRRRNGN